MQFKVCTSTSNLWVQVTHTQSSLTSFTQPTMTTSSGDMLWLKHCAALFSTSPHPSNCNASQDKAEVVEQLLRPAAMP